MSRIVTLSRCRTNLIWLETGTLPCFFYGATDGHPTTHSFLSGKKYFSEEESLAMSSHSLKGPCSIQHPFSILSPCCLFLATFSTQSPCCLPLAPSTPSTLILLPPTITTCGSCVYTPSFLPLSPFRPPCSMNDENLFLFFLQTLLIQCRHSLLIFNILRAQNKLQRALLKNSF